MHQDVITDCSTNLYHHTLHLLYLAKGLDITEKEAGVVALAVQQAFTTTMFQVLQSRPTDDKLYSIDPDSFSIGNGPLTRYGKK